jgi:hypothetical protein
VPVTGLYYFAEVEKVLDFKVAIDEEDFGRFEQFCFPHSQQNPKSFYA